MANQPAAPVLPPRRSPWLLKVRLAAMMFLQYWPLGIWGVTVGTYIAANTGSQGTQMFSAGFVGYSTAAGAIGSLLSPVVIGFLSDRYFAAERLVAVMHVGCALAAWRMYETSSQTAFFCFLLLYFQCFAPAGALTNKIALKNLSAPDAEYPRVRIFATLGWITAGLVLGFVWPWLSGESIEATRTPLLLSALGSGVMAVYALSLPHTPPAPRAGGVALGTVRDSRELFRNRALVVFLLVSVLACIPSMAYNNFGNLFLNRNSYARPAALMTLGQVSDVLALWATPWLLPRFGLRTIFAAGIASWGIRYALLAAGSYYDIGWPVYAAILIHGPCYVFVYVIGVMYVDRLAGDTHRGAAQGLYAMASAGLGHLFGALMVGLAQAAFLTPANTAPPPYNWTAFWLVPAVVSVCALIVFRVTFSKRHAN